MMSHRMSHHPTPRGPQARPPSLPRWTRCWAMGTGASWQRRRRYSCSASSLGGAGAAATKPAAEEKGMPYASCHAPFQ